MLSSAGWAGPGRAPEVRTPAVGGTGAARCLCWDRPAAGAQPRSDGHWGARRPRLGYQVSRDLGELGWGREGAGFGGTRAHPGKGTWDAGCPHPEGTEPPRQSLLQDPAKEGVPGPQLNYRCSTLRRGLEEGRTWGQLKPRMARDLSQGDLEKFLTVGFLSYLFQDRALGLWGQGVPL